MMKKYTSLLILIAIALARVRRGYYLILHFKVGCLSNHINANLAQSNKTHSQNHYQKTVNFFFDRYYLENERQTCNKLILF